MAAENGRQAPALKERILKQPTAFSFFQMVRLLRLMSGHTGREDEEFFLERHLKIRPHLSLGFPGSDVAAIEEVAPPSDDSKEIAKETGIPDPTPDYRYQLSVTFLGIYGASSPLPTFYTEDLLDDRMEDVPVTRDFMDIFNRPLYRQFYQCWSKYRWLIKLLDEADEEYHERLYSMLGLGHEVLRRTVPGVKGLLRYLGLFTQFPRSALGLKTLLTDALGLPNISIDQCLPRQVPIAEEQRCLIGLRANVLGEDCHLGLQVTDQQSRFRINMGPLDAETLHHLLPDMPLHFRLGALLHLFLTSPLECELRLVVDKDQAMTTQPGNDRWSSLGYNTWLFSGESVDDHLTTSFGVVKE